MAREPQFPDDAAIGDSKRAAPAGSAGEASAAPTPSGKAAEAAGERAGDGKRTKQIVTGAAIGIGSAAIVAALLYANRRGKNDRS